MVYRLFCMIKNSRGAVAYLALAGELIRRTKLEGKRTITGSIVNG